MPETGQREVLGTSTLTYKFQVTIPKKVREEYKFREGDVLVFMKEDGRLTLRRAKEC